jgi:hypothetical protein
VCPFWQVHTVGLDLEGVMSCSVECSVECCNSIAVFAVYGGLASQTCEVLCTAGAVKQQDKQRGRVTQMHAIWAG